MDRYIFEMDVADSYANYFTSKDLIELTVIPYSPSSSSATSYAASYAASSECTSDGNTPIPTPSTSKTCTPEPPSLFTVYINAKLLASLSAKLRRLTNTPILLDQREHGWPSVDGLKALTEFVYRQGYTATGTTPDHPALFHLKAWAIAAHYEVYEMQEMAFERLRNCLQELLCYDCSRTVEQVQMLRGLLDYAFTTRVQDLDGLVSIAITDTNVFAYLAGLAALNLDDLRSSEEDEEWFTGLIARSTLFAVNIINQLRQPTEFCSCLIHGSEDGSIC